MENFDTIIKNSIKEAMVKSGLAEESKPVATKPKAKKAVAPSKKKITEALVSTPKTFILKTEKLSSKTKEMLEVAYKTFIDQFNKIGTKLDAANKQEANNVSSEYRSLSIDRTNSFNAIKLYDLYFANISDVNSQVNTDSLPHMRLTRDFGTFDQWQFDFIAACLACKSGWAMVVYEPSRKIYMNVFSEGNDCFIPVGAIPVLVMNMGGICYIKDYGLDARSYVISMMREINWHVVEARMTIVEQTDLSQLWNIVPLSHTQQTDLSGESEQAMPAPVEATPPQNNSNAINASTRSTL